jgi:predicted transcriptional regulator
MTLVQDIMTRELVVVNEDLSLRDCVELLARQHLSGAPVIAGAEIAGVITLSDIASFLSTLAPVPRDEPENGWDEEPPPGSVEGEDVAVGAYFQELWADAGADLVERARATGAPEWDVLGEHTVQEAMSRRLWSIGPDVPVREAARRMEEADVHRLLVTREGRLLGLVTTADITRAVAEGRV